MTPQTVAQALEALEVQLREAVEVHEQRVQNVLEANELLKRASASANDSAVWVQAVQAAHDELERELRRLDVAAMGDDWATMRPNSIGAPPVDDEVPAGAEAYGDGRTVLQRGEDESDDDWQARVDALQGFGA